MNNLVVPVPRLKVQEQIKRLNKYIIDANSITTSQVTILEDCEEAREILYKAKGLFECLNDFKMIGNPRDVKAEIDRIEEKIKELKSGRRVYES